EQDSAKKKIVPRSKDRNVPKMEVDLHIHQLVPSTRGMSNYDMLNLQLETAKRQLEFAMRKRIQKVVFIHGKGAGVLQEELKYLFGRYDNLKYYDADYRKYGIGATEVYIFQNPK
ncbi:MAG: Smr/MutS family protein, partial [Eudoraea sp.]|nr:Smr/MutS family protein [Eudoraea sp.]